ncbi:chromosome segregation protein SMC [Loigolactobacillus zhaoyuanensis]|uniref:chromosome segregation protein SMC n=1 Tax=Loigolactobacillus zhaoyuanensis TaxID=2486017 RepID=UPI000F738225|nr:chromosome segregation protein SMC [Loigolactobacillus zhaoyuanensis]
MELKTLEINGFKSFADKTVIKFDHGITGIVGPNGSGKSNITEAIRWALGEQSAKSLRGGKMPDIIFAGSSERKPLNRAEVTLEFDNQDHQLKSDYDQISVTRVLYRDGTSAFYLNQKSCRLKDIVNLFMDSGLGRESFSIISQGKIAAIFNSKPEDRRGIIEEAAGVVKYKQRKKEADSQLLATADNLHRVSDIIAELAQQVEPLKEQSSLAKDYLQQKKQLDEITKTLLVRQIESKVATKQTQQQALKTAQENVVLAQRNQTEFQAKVTAQKAQQQKNTQRLDTLQQDQLRITKQQAELSGQAELAGERRQVAQDKLAELTAELKKQQQQLNELQQVIATEKTALQQADTDLQQKQQLVKNYTQAQQVDEATIKRAVEDLRQQYIDQLQQQTTLHNEAVYLEREQKQTQVQDQKQQAAAAALKQRITELAEQRTTAQATATKLDQAQQQIQQQQQKLQTQLQQNQQQYDQQQQQWYQALAIMQKGEAKQASLAEMKDDYSGFYAGVRSILKHKGQLAGVVGAVAELLTVPPKYNQALEAILGNQLQAVVVADEAAGKRSIAYLKQQHLGRATFLPLAVMQPQQLSSMQQQQLADQPGFIGVAADLVQFAPAHANVMRHLLGRIVIATDLAAAIKLAAILQHRVRIVTLEGDILNPGGAMTGGGKTKQNGLLVREQEQRDLVAQLAKMKAQLATKEQALQTLKQQIDDATQQSTAAEQQLKKLTQQELENQAVLKDLARQQTQLDREQTAANFDNQQQSDAVAEHQQKQTANQQQTKQIDAAIKQIQADLAAKQAQLASWQSNQAATATQRQQAQTDLAVAQEKQKQRQQTNRQHVEQQSTLQAAIVRDQQQAAQLTQQLSLQTQDHASNAADLVRAAKQLKQIDAEIKSVKAAREQLSATLQQQEQQLAHAQTGYQQQTAAQQRIETTLTNLNESLNQALAQLESDYSLSFEAAKVAALTTDQAKLQQQQKLLKLGLADLGEVNLGAIAEYERVSQRYEFLLAQRGDLLSAREQLTTTMTEMDQEVSLRFKATFDATAKAFAEIFPQMFGGGQASLSLTNPADLLTTGIEITAQPPGKKLQQLSLLSGGERALTAITLLFAIINVRPVPLCILDEVEAALDEANVERFGRFLQRYDQQTQFVVITHRKGTMMAMDVLFGVAMQESGVSHMVSVELATDKQEAHA